MAIILRLLLIVALVALNAFFVAAEYALLSVRRTRIEQLAREGDSRARLVQALLGDFGLLISGTQLGVTIASLLMGWLGESIMAAAIGGALEGHVHQFVSMAVAHTIAVGVAFAFVATLLMVLGELVPKTLAYERAERVALLIARPMTVILRSTKYGVRGLEGLAKMVLLALGHRGDRIHGPLHTPDEVNLIVSAIRKRGLLEEEQEEMIRSVFDLHRVLVREIMVPWPKVTRFPMTQNLHLLLERIVKDEHSRVPIYDDSPDHIVGVLYTKDLHGVVFDRLRRGVPLDDPSTPKWRWWSMSLERSPVWSPSRMCWSRSWERSRTSTTAKRRPSRKLATTSQSWTPRSDCARWPTTTELTCHGARDTKRWRDSSSPAWDRSRRAARPLCSKATAIRWSKWTAVAWPRSASRNFVR